MPGYGQGGGFGQGGGAGGGMGRGGRGGLGPSGNCVCPACGTKIPHTPGTPCMEQTCPKCGSRMVRE